tara:strand:- start:17118 stop:21626 length:4509 start_codon:yes stop_codon:yes gene_type:complete
VPLFAFKKSDSARHTFIENKGQWPSQVKFKAEINPNSTIYFENNAVHYQFVDLPNHKHPEIASSKKEVLKGHTFKAIFIGSNENVEHKSYGTSSYYYNYFLGNERSKWKGEVFLYEEINYKELYPGIDLICYVKDNQLKYDYHIKVGHDVKQIKIDYEGVESPTISNGQLLIKHHQGELIESKPYAFQINEMGEEVAVECNYAINEEGQVSFEFPKGYNEALDLIIDPVLIFSTYSGSTSDNFGTTATYDREGSAYMGGISFGTGYVTTLGAFDLTYNGGNMDIAISKFNSDGSSLVYSTYLGGSGTDTPHSLVVNDDLELYVLGASSSSNFPVTINTFDSTFNSSANVSTEINANFINGSDIVVTKFSANGSNLIGSTFYGGNGIDGINSNQTSTGQRFGSTTYNYGDSHRGEIVLDTNGNCYIGTSSTSTNLPGTLNSNSGGQDGLIVKFSSNLNNVIWARYHGGTGIDAIYSLKITNDNRVVVGGGTRSFSNFPTTNNAYQTTSSGGRTDGFISIIASNGSTIERSTFIGTSAYDQVYFVEFDRFNNIYGLGQTRSSSFPIKNSAISNPGTGQFIVKLNPNLDSLIMSTTFGSGNRINISPTAFLVDRCLNIYVSGWGGNIAFNNDTTFGEERKILPASMPLSNDAFRTTTNGNDFYLYVINGNTDSLFYGSFFGGLTSDDHVDGGTSRFDKNGIIYQSVCASCGLNNRTDFPTNNGLFNRVNSNNCNNAIFKMDFQILPTANFGVDQSAICLNEANNDTIILLITDRSIRSDITTWNFNGDTVITSFSDTTIFITSAGNYFIRQEIQDTICAAGDFIETLIQVRPDNIQLSTIADTNICFSDSIDLIAFTNAVANNFVWSRQADFSNPLASNDSIINVKLDSGLNVFYVQAGNTITNSCEKEDSIVVNYFPVSISATISADTVCENTLVGLAATQQNIDNFKWDFGNGSTDTSSLNHSILYPTPGDYIIQLSVSSNACNAEDTITFNLRIAENDLTFNSLTDTIACGTNGLQIQKPSFGNVQNYLWSSNNDFSDTLNNFPLDSSFMLNETDSAKYFLKISNRYCERIDSLNAEYIEYQLELNPIIDSVCTPFNTELQTTIIGTDSFRIFFGDGNSTRVDSTPSINFPNPGIYTISLIGSNQKCNFNDTISRTVNVFQNVSLAPISDTVVCNKDTIQLRGNSFGTAASFTWSDNPNFQNPLNANGDSSIFVSPNDRISLYLRGTNGICEAIDTVNIEVDSVAVEIPDLESICLEDTLSIEALTINATSALSYLWSPNDSILTGQNTNEITMAPKNDFELTLITSNANGCQDFDTAFIEVNIPAFDSATIFSSVDSAYKTQQVQLFTDRNGANLVYFWEPAEDFNNPDLPDPFLKAEESKTYRVRILDLNTGCEVIAFLELTVFEINCDEPNIFIPTAFTPNQDLSNDILFIRGELLESIEFQLFNRWGEKVFESFEINNGWDGTYKGRAVDPGVFVYHLKAICLDGQEFVKKGNITLIR